MNVEQSQSPDRKDRNRINHRQMTKIASFVSDLMNGRRESVVFVFRKGKLVEAVTGYEIQQYAPIKPLENGINHCTIE